jgi:hypothetical protein
MRHVREPEQLDTWKEAPVENNTTYVEATSAGAAFLGARSAWPMLAGAGVNHALAQNPVLAAVRPAARCAALRPIPAPVMSLVPMASELTSVARTRKQTTNVHTTRINAGGYGAMGPHPEREPA